MPLTSAWQMQESTGTSEAKKLRVLMTASTLPRWPGDSEPAFVLQLAESLASEFDVTIIAPHCRGALRDEQVGRVKIHRYRYAPIAWQNLAYEGGMLQRLGANPLRWLLVPGLVLSQMLSMRRLHRQHGFDLLHVHWIVPQGLAAMLLKRLGLMHIPALLTAHGGDLFALRRANWLKRAILRTMDRISVVSRAMVEVCDSLGLPPQRLFVRSMGVDLQHRFGTSLPFEDRSGLVFVGRLVEKKGVEHLIRAFARLTSDFPDETLTIVGDGPLRRRLEGLVAASGAGNLVKFIGAVANEEVPTYLNRARIAVVPSVVASDGDQEGLGLVAVEAMGCGCVVACSDLPALRDVVTDGVTGRVFAAGDDEEMIRTLRELIDDPEGSARLAAAGRDEARRKFDWSSIAREYADHYRQLIRGGGR